MMPRARMFATAIGLLMATCAVQQAAARPAGWKSAAFSSTPNIPQVLPQILRYLAGNATLQAAVTTIPPNEDAITAAAQQLYNNQASSSAGTASSPTAGGVVSLVETEVTMNQSAPVWKAFLAYMKQEGVRTASPRMAFLQSLQVQGSMYAFSCAATLRDSDGSWMSWTQSFAGLLGSQQQHEAISRLMLKVSAHKGALDYSDLDLTLESVWVCDAGTEECTITGARSQALDALMLLFVHSIGNTEHVPVSVPTRAFKSIPLARGAGSSGSSWLSSIDPATIQTFNSAISSMVSAFGEIISLFGHHSSSTIIAKDCCLGFNTFTSDVQLNTFECLDDSVAPQFVQSYFGPIMSWAFTNPQQAFAELLAWEYCHASNWTADAMQLTNTGTSTVQVAHVFKNHDDAHGCSNWVIATFQGQFTLAPDLIVWLKSSSSWGGMDTSMDEYIQQVPHEISLADVQAIQEFVEVLTYGQLAQMQGLPYTWPTIPNCS